jgi:hypothetical protein
MNQALYAHMNNKRKKNCAIGPMTFYNLSALGNLLPLCNPFNSYLTFHQTIFQTFISNIFHNCFKHFSFTLRLKHTQTDDLTPAVLKSKHYKYPQPTLQKGSRYPLNLRLTYPTAFWGSTLEFGGHK